MLPRFLCVLLTCAFPVVLRAADAPHDLQIFLLIGQSNMAGRGPMLAEDYVPHPRIFMLNRDLAWVPATDPLHFDKPKMVGVGPGSSFARALAEREPSAIMGLVPAAVGGTSLEEWKAGGKLYVDAVTRARAALKSGRLAGILWHQGEADSASTKARTYATRFAAMIAQLRADLNAPDVPVIVGETGRFRAGATEINAVLATLPASVPRCAFVSAEGLTDKGDKLHFDRESQHELGRRYAAAWLRLTNAAPLVVLKLDDVRAREGKVDPRWQRAVEFLQSRHISAGLGVIADSLEGDHPEYFAWLRAVVASGEFELWSHGYDHRTWMEGDKKFCEFAGPSYETQRAHLEKAQALVKDKVGVTMRAFGAGYNAIDAATVRAFTAVPDLRVWLYGPKQAPGGVFVAQRSPVEMERPTTKANFEAFVSAFEARPRELYYVLQGHPASWNDEHFAAFVKIVDYLIAHHARFVLPSELALIVTAQPPRDEGLPTPNGER